MDKVYDKHGQELNIGDRVHYKKEAREVPLSMYSDKMFKIEAKDQIFVIDGFVENPLKRDGQPEDSWRDSPIWVTGDGVITRRGTKNSIAPTALVKLDPIGIKKNLGSLDTFK